MPRKLKLQDLSVKEPESNAKERLRKDVQYIVGDVLVLLL